MCNPVMNRLRRAVRVEIAQAFAVDGYARPRDIARRVCAAFPDDVLAVGSRLAEDALTNLARNLLKQSLRGHQETRLMQPFWSDPPPVGSLPCAISIPAVDGDSGNNDTAIYKPLSRTTVSDLNAHLELLTAQIAADTRRYRALRELRDQALARGARPESLMWAPVQSALGAAAVAA